MMLIHPEMRNGASKFKMPKNVAESFCKCPQFFTLSAKQIIFVEISESERFNN